MLNVFVCWWVAMPSGPCLLLLLQEHHLRFSNNINFPCCLKGKKNSSSSLLLRCCISIRQREIFWVAHSGLLVSTDGNWELGHSPPDSQYLLCMLSQLQNWWSSQQWGAENGSALDTAIPDDEMRRRASSPPYRCLSLATMRAEALRNGRNHQGI